MADVTLNSDPNVSAEVRDVANTISAMIGTTQFAPAKGRSYTLTNDPFKVPASIESFISGMAENKIIDSATRNSLIANNKSNSLTASQKQAISDFANSPLANNGFSSKYSNFIFVNKSIPEENIAGTILHELGHRFGVPDGNTSTSLHAPAFYKWVLDVAKELGFPAPDQEQKFIESGGKKDESFLDLLPGFNKVVLAEFEQGDISADDYATYVSWSSEQERSYTIEGDYETYLGRNPDEAGFNWFMTNGMGFDQMRDAFLVSSEHRSYAITQDYETLLGREPDASGFANLLNSSMTLDEVRNAMLASSEYKSRQGAIATYASELGRQASQAEVAAFAKSGKSLSDLTAQLDASAEHRTYSISQMYRDLLGREPDQGGLQWWDTSGGSLDQIRAAFMNCDEHRAYVAQTAAAQTPSTSQTASTQPAAKPQTSTAAVLSGVTPPVVIAERPDYVPTLLPQQIVMPNDYSSNIQAPSGLGYIIDYLRQSSTANSYNDPLSRGASTYQDYSAPQSTPLQAPVPSIITPPAPLFNNPYSGFMS